MQGFDFLYLYIPFVVLTICLHHFAGKKPWSVSIGEGMLTGTFLASGWIIGSMLRGAPQ